MSCISSFKKLVVNFCLKDPIEVVIMNQYFDLLSVLCLIYCVNLSVQE